MEMTDITPSDFKKFNKFMVTNFRLGLGPLFTGKLGNIGHIMVLTTIGRKSGLRRRTPVNYAILRGSVYCVAGFGQRADWFRNVQADPNVEVWIGNQGWTGQAHHIEDPQDWLPAYRQVMINSGFAAQSFMGIDPLTAPDNALLELGADTPTVRIDIDYPLTGRAGRPGDLIWVWPVVGLALVAAWLLQQRER